MCFDADNNVNQCKPIPASRLSKADSVNIDEHVCKVVSVTDADEFSSCKVVSSVVERDLASMKSTARIILSGFDIHSSNIHDDKEQLLSNGNACVNTSADNAHCDAHGKDRNLLVNGNADITSVEPFDEFDLVSASDKMPFSASDMMTDMILYIECLVACVLTLFLWLTRVTTIPNSASGHSTHLLMTIVIICSLFTGTLAMPMVCRTTHAVGRFHIINETNHEIIPTS